MGDNSEVKTAAGVDYKLCSLDQNVKYQVMANGTYTVDPFFEKQFIKEMEYMKAREEYLSGLEDFMF